MLQETADKMRQEAIEKAEYDLQLAKIKSENASSEQSVESAKENMEKSQVTAPITGVVTSVSVAAGDTYSGGAIAVIDDVSSYEVSAKVDEYDVGKIQVGQRAVIRTNATGDTEYAGKVLSVAPKSTSSSSSSTRYSYNGSYSRPTYNSPTRYTGTRSSYTRSSASTSTTMTTATRPTETVSTGAPSFQTMKAR